MGEAYGKTFRDGFNVINCVSLIWSGGALCLATKAYCNCDILHPFQTTGLNHCSASPFSLWIESSSPNSIDTSLDCIALNIKAYACSVPMWPCPLQMLSVHQGPLLSLTLSCCFLLSPRVHGMEILASIQVSSLQPFGVISIFFFSFFFSHHRFHERQSRGKLQNT